jgi:hypothetical protein
VAEVSEVTDPAFLDGLEGWTLQEVRSRREEVNETETGLSYLRRIVQGRLDIVVAEQGHRRTGERADVSELVDELPSILAGNVHAPGLGRFPTLLGPGRLDRALEEHLENILPEGRLANLSDASEEELAATAGALADFERSVSSTRRAVLDVLDRLQDEIVRRYRTGEATVDNLLP